MKAFAPTALVAVLIALAAPAAAAPAERRLHSDNIDASSFLWNDWNKFVENYHPNYVADDDPATAWVEGAKSSGAGEWLRIQVTPLDKTTRVRLRVRNGYQKSKDLWKANARAKAVTVRLLPSKVEKQVVLTDTDGWQEVAVDQPNGTLRAVELAIGSVYEGTKYADLCISDVQVFATSETPDNPAFEKSKLANLMSWRSARIAAAKVFSQKKIDLPLYPAYATKTSERADHDVGMARSALLEAAKDDPAFAKEWKDALAAAMALEKDLGAMTRAQLAPASQARLVAVDGLELTELDDVSEQSFESSSLRLPMLGLVSAMFADQLRVLDVKDKRTISEFEAARGACRDSAATWVMRTRPKEATGPARVTAIAVGGCAKVAGREGWYIVSTIEMMIYDAAGRLVLVVGNGHLDAYRWTTDGGKPMLAGGRGLLADGTIVEARRREPVAAK
ncbi:MAG TPA: hypothetical protein VN253_07010 [Kofleriaceae bacterium]|nr:hypothetical protein [Kofleriaceae bacterium]